MDNLMTLNVGGTTFLTSMSTLKKYPETRLGRLTTSSQEYVVDKHLYFFDRSPDLFGRILDFYRNDEIHLPANCCSQLIQKELDYWEIPYSDIPECCRSAILKKGTDLKTVQKLKISTEIPSAFDGNNKCANGIQRKIWLFVDEPLSSTPAKCYNFVYCLIVILSVFMELLFTSPDFRIPVESTNNVTLMQNIGLLRDMNNPKAVFFLTTEVELWWYIVDDCLLVFFTLEFCTRFAASPSKITFLKNWLNILDVVLNVSMWFRFVVRQFGFTILLKNRTLLAINQFCFASISFRMFRITRLSKQFDGLKILLTTIRESIKELVLLFLTILMLAVFFANIIFFAEMSESTTFPSSFEGVWWSVITMTTVGYGDHYPKSVLGKCVGACCAVCGVIIIAMPIAIIATNFNTFYSRMQDIRNFENRVKKINREKLSIRNNSIKPQS
ncbi:KCNC1 [Mytilus coruscus]|uniref:KCNC1 n=1 Tax=Mytilus coruscus TaxID=42192 RepID=A0A6J8ADB2_MYTCO|nr:KCNC1 [Mytilus coruscus]